MVAGLERYYQIARCFRDEDFRADRQPEFTQLDVEACFLDEEDLYELSEEVFVPLWHEVLDVELPAPFPRMPYEEAMRRFGVDRPDLRFGDRARRPDPVLRDTPFRVFKAAHVGAVVLPGGAGHDPQGLRRLDGVGEAARGQGPGLGHVPGGRLPRRSGP